MDRFERVLNEIAAQLEKIAPYAEAERAQATERAQNVGPRIAKAQAQEQDRLTKLSKAKEASKFKLMDLPYTIRTKILDEVIMPIRDPVFFEGRSRNGPPPHPIPLPPVARTSDTRLRLEACLVLLEKTIVSIDSIRANEKVQKWLGKVDFTTLGGDTSYENGFDAVRMLRFRFFSRFPFRKLGEDAPNNDILLMSRCRNLSTVYLTFHTDDIINGYEYFDFKSVEQLRTAYRLDGMLELMQLKNLYLWEKMNEKLYDDWYIEGTHGLNALRDWFKGEFEARGMMSVDVRSRIYHQDDLSGIEI